MPPGEIDQLTLDWATPEFLTDVIKIDEGKWIVTDVDKSASQVVKPGDNYVGSLYRIKTRLSKDVSEGEGKTVELSLVVKTLPSQKDFAELLAKSTPFPTEINMYTEVIPKLIPILNKAYPGEDNTLTPKFYHALKKAPFNLIMEDLYPRGFAIADRRKGLDLPHCELAIKTLARFHAASIALKAENEDLVKMYDEHPFLKGPGELFDNLCSKSMAGIAEVVERWPEESGKKYAEKLRNKAKVIGAEMVDCFGKSSKNFKVLNHGDFWVNNIMFNHEQSTGKVKEVKFVDLQLSYYASPALDLQYFIHTSPTEDIRARKTEHLLKLYHQQLCDTLKLLKLDEHLISYEEFIEDYEEKNVYGMYAALFVLPMALCDPNDATHFMDENSGDQEAFKKAALNKFSNDSLTKALKRLLPLFESKNVL